MPTSPLGAGQCGLQIPAWLPAGNYELRLFAQNTLTRLARSSAFSVRRASLTATSGTTPITAGTTMTVEWADVGNPVGTDWIGLFPQGASDRDEAHFHYACAGGTLCGVQTGARPFTLPAGLTPGWYEFRLFAEDGYTLLAESLQFNVVGASLSVAAAGGTPPPGTSLTVGAGSTVRVSWFGVPSPTTTDWIGIYDPSAAEGAPPLKPRRYLSGTPLASEGAMDIMLDSDLPPGSYQLRLFSASLSVPMPRSMNFTISGVVLRAGPTSLPAGGQLAADWGIIDWPTKFDWIDVYVPTAGDGTPVAGPRTYLSCTSMASSARSAGSCTVPLSLHSVAPGGTYELRLFSDRSGSRLATSNQFTLASLAPTPTRTPTPTPVMGVTRIAMTATPAATATHPPKMGSTTPTVVASVMPGTPVLPPGALSAQAFVTNYGSSNISVIPEPAEPVAASGEPVGRGLQGVTLHRKGADQRLYVANSVDNTVSVIDVNSRHLVAVVPVGSVPIGIAATPADADGQVYVANNGYGTGNTVSVIQTNTNTVSSTITVGQGPRGVGTGTDGRAYVANNSSDTVSVISGGVVVRTITVGREPSAVRVDPLVARLYVANSDGNSVSVVNPDTGALISTVRVGSAPIDLAVHPNGTRLYVANAGSHDVSVVEIDTWQVSTIPVGQLPTGVAVSADGGRLYVVNSLSNTISVIDTRNGAILETVAVGTLPQAVVAR